MTWLSSNHAMGSLLTPLKFYRDSFVVNGPEESEVAIRSEYFGKIVKQTPSGRTIWGLDRHFGTEYVMAQYYGRNLDIETLLKVEKQWSKFTVQILLTCNLDERIEREVVRGKPEEGDAAKIDHLWKEYRERTSLKTHVIDTSGLEPKRVAEKAYQFILCRMASKL